MAATLDAPLTPQAKTRYHDNSKSYSTHSRNASLCLLQHLSFPTCRGDAARFNFSLSSNQDIEGPQGSFECIQQTSSRSVPFLSTWLGLEAWRKSKQISYCCSFYENKYTYTNSFLYSFSEKRAWLEITNLFMFGMSFATHYTLNLCNFWIQFSH